MNEIQNILQGCKKGDLVSQERLYKLFYPALFALCRLFFDDSHEALTALNNGMLKVYKNIDAFNEGKGSLFNWMYTIIRNEAISLLSTKKTVFVEISVVENQAADVWQCNLNQLDIQDIKTCLMALPMATRNVCRLYYLDGFTIADVAKMLNISAGTAKWHLSEARKKLKPIFEQHYSC